MKEDTYLQNKNIIHINLTLRNGQKLTDEELKFVLLHMFTLSQRKKVGHPPDFFEEFNQNICRAEELDIKLDNPVSGRPVVI